MKNENMSGFISSFGPILKKLKKFKIELILISLAGLITLVSGILYIHDYVSSKNTDEETLLMVSPEAPILKRIVVDINGAVNNPGVYEVSGEARLKDVILKAGDLSDSSDRDFFTRNFNLAKFVTDQEKIYIPTQSEITYGLFTEPQKSFDNTVPVVSENTQENTSQININSSTPEELDKLPGVGITTANKIIKNRPYVLIEELLTKKVVGKSLYQKIKEMITL